MIYFTSDNHFGHENIIRYCNRPFKDVDHMDRVMIKNWNSIVKPTDTVFHLGDISFHKKIPKYLEQLNGKIIWIKGNHDSSEDTKIVEMMIKLGGITWQLIHNPADTLYSDILCGHVHEKWKVKIIKDRILINVGVDVWDFKPITIEQIIKAVKEEIKNG